MKFLILGNYLWVTEGGWHGRLETSTAISSLLFLLKTHEKLAGPPRLCHGPHLLFHWAPADHDTSRHITGELPSGMASSCSTVHTWCWWHLVVSCMVMVTHVVDSNGGRYTRPCQHLYHVSARGWDKCCRGQRQGGSERSWGSKKKKGALLWNVKPCRS